MTEDESWMSLHDITGDDILSVAWESIENSQNNDDFKVRSEGYIILESIGDKGKADSIDCQQGISPLSSSDASDTKDSINQLLSLLGKLMPSHDDNLPLQFYIKSLVSLRLLLLRPSRTIEEEELVDLILSSYLSYSKCGRDQNDMILMLAREYIFLQQQLKQQKKRDMVARKYPTKVEFHPNWAPLIKDSEFKKYFKLLEMGLPLEAVKHAFKRDVNLDSEKYNMKSRTRNKCKDSEDLPLKKNPEYKKYFKMLKVGLPIGSVRNALQRDGKDPSVINLDPEKTFKSQMHGRKYEKKVDPNFSLKDDDPNYRKYFRMLKVGLPVEAVKNALKRDGKDPDTIGFLKAKYYRAVTIKQNVWKQTTPKKTSDTIKAKNEKNVKKNKLANLIDKKRSLNGSITLARINKPYTEIANMVNNLEHEEFNSTQLKALCKSLPNDEERKVLTNYIQKGKESPEEMKKKISALSECEKYMIAMLDVKNAPIKFRAMLQGVTKRSETSRKSSFSGGGIALAAKQRKERRADSTENAEKALSPFTGRDIAALAAQEVALKNNPIHKKYFKMFKIGLPIVVVEHAMKRDGVEYLVMDHVLLLSTRSRRRGDPLLKDLPQYQKYSRMLKVGLTSNVVRHAMKRDGNDATVLDLA